MSETELFEIDGSVLEGGGQILRNAISLSAILGISVRVKNIRAGRKKPGLAAQHLKGIQLVAQMCKAQLNGAKIGSTEIEFRPGRLTGGRFEADTQTAGSISLLLQIALPCALFADAPVTLVLRGGTNADMAPQFDYMTEVFLPVLRKFGGGVDNFVLYRRGYYPKGGGHVTVDIKPVKQLNNVTMTERGAVSAALGWSFTAGTLPVKMAYQMADGAREPLRGVTNINIECYKEDYNIAPDNCAGIILKCETSTGCILGSDALGKRGLEPHAVGKDAGQKLRAEIDSGACVDSHTQDQIIIYMCLANGLSSVRVGEVTLHTTTAIHVAELLAKTKFNIRPDGGQNIIECTGLGFINNKI